MFGITAFSEAPFSSLGITIVNASSTCAISTSTSSSCLAVKDVASNLSSTTTVSSNANAVRNVTSTNNLITSISASGLIIGEVASVNQLVLSTSSAAKRVATVSATPNIAVSTTAVGSKLSFGASNITTALSTTSQANIVKLASSNTTLTSSVSAQAQKVLHGPSTNNLITTISATANAVKSFGSLIQIGLFITASGRYKWEPVQNVADIWTPTSTINYAVTVANVEGQNIFLIDGVNNPVLNLKRGNTYIFNQSDTTNSNHPLAFKNSTDDSYSNGVSATGTAGSDRIITFVVPSDAPADLKYYCTVHGNAMGNTISVTSFNWNVVTPPADSWSGVSVNSKTWTGQNDASTNWSEVA